jgi:hypothetical protein
VSQTSDQFITSRGSERRCLKVPAFGIKDHQTASNILAVKDIPMGSQTCLVGDDWRRAIEPIPMWGVSNRFVGQKILGRRKNAETGSKCHRSNFGSGEPDAGDVSRADTHSG